MKKKLVVIIIGLFITSFLFALNTNFYTDYEPPAIPLITEQFVLSEPTEETKLQKTISVTCINLTDQYADDDSLSKLYAEENIFDRLQGFNQELNENENYYEISFQALQSLEYYNSDDNFVKVYNRKGDKIKNQEIEIKGIKHYVTSLNTIQVNRNFNNIFITALGKGDAFTDEDFTLNSLNNIPILLGSNYRNDFSIGDILKLNYLGIDLTFKIKGFLAPNITLEKNKEIFSLDNYICIPNFHFVSTSKITEESEYFIFLMRYYLQKNRGYFQCETSFKVNELEQQIDTIAQKYELNYIIIDDFYTFTNGNNLK